MNPLKNKTKDQLIKEIEELQKQVRELEVSKNECKQLKETLRQTRSYLENLIDYASAPIIVWDSTSEITRFNPAFEHLTGYTTEDVIGLKLSMLFPGISREESLKEIARTLNGKYWESVEIPILCKNGDIRIVLWNSANIYTEDEKTLLATIAQGVEITERKQAENALRWSEQKMRIILDSIPDMVLQLDLNRKIIWANKATLKLNPHAIGQLCYKALLGRSHPCPGCPIVNALKTGQIERRIIHLHSEKGAGESYWDDIGIPIKDARGKISSIIKFARNITDSKQAEEELIKYRENLEDTVKERTKDVELGAKKIMESQKALTLLLEDVKESREELKKANRRLEEANKELESFSYSVSHDLRAPLRHIDRFVDLLNKRTTESLDKEGKRYLNIISGSVQRMSDLIDNLLNYSRMGRSVMQKRSVSLEQLINEAKQDLENRMEGRNITWKIGKLPKVNVDRTMLGFVLVNLISNAIKFTGECKRAQIEIGCKPGKENEIVFFIRDNGAGFDEKYVDKLFGVFQRLHREDEFEGTGIGLANVRRIIHRHGGRTWAEGSVGKGATFYFSLPKE